MDWKVLREEMYGNLEALISEVKSALRWDKPEKARRVLREAQSLKYMYDLEEYEEVLEELEEKIEEVEWELRKEEE